MNILEAPDVQPMPFGLLSVASTVNADDRAAHVGYQYTTACEAGVSTTVDPCKISVSVDSGTVTVTLSAPLSHPVTISAGEESATIAEGDLTGEIEFVEPYSGPMLISGPLGAAFILDVDSAVDGDVGWTKDGLAQTTSVFSRSFILYARTICKAVGYDQINRAVDRINRGEGRALETQVALQAAAAGNSVAYDASGDNGNGTFTTGGGINGAIAAVLADWFTKTSDRPTLHIPAHLLGLVRGVSRHGTHLETTGGALVSSGTGYLPSTIFATGQVGITRGTMTSPPDYLNTTTNEVTSFAERAYSFDFGCHAPSVLTVVEAEEEPEIP